MSDSKYTVTKVPREPSAILELLGSKPPAWEWLLFAARLREGLATQETKWRDYTLGYTMAIGPTVSKEELGFWTSEMMSRAIPLAANVEKVISKPAQDAAFGLPGQSGDPDLINHMAMRLIDLYAGLLDWAEDFRAARLPTGTDRLKDLGVSLVSQPIASIRDFVLDYTSSLEDSLSKLAAGSADNIVIPMTITFEIDDAVIAEFNALLEEAVA